jgi:hypothetical protein
MIPAKEQEIILSYLVDIPPDEYKNDCDTDDREDHWIQYKVFYSCLHDFLKNHFAGTPLPSEKIYIKDLEITIPLNESYLQIIGLELDYYLQLYNVLSWGWKYIYPVLKAIESEMIETSTLENTDEAESLNPSIPETPGQALIEVINQHFHGLFYTLFPEKVTGNYYKEYSPRKAYSFKLEEKKIAILKEKKVEELTNREKRNIASHDRKVEKEQELLKPFVSSEKFYISICLKNKKEDETMKNRLKTLKAIVEKKQTYITRSQHPRNNRQGHAVNKGVVVPATKKGGVYRND